MQVIRLCVTACLAAATTFGQVSEEELRSKVAKVYYPPLAIQARILGDVRLRLDGKAITLLSGHPLLAPTAVYSATAFDSIQNQSTVYVTYHFILVDNVSVPVSTTVKRGNAFERTILRIFGFKTEKVVHYNQCQPGVPPPNNAKIDGAAIEIWIYGRDQCRLTTAGSNEVMVHEIGCNQLRVTCSAN